VNLNGLDTTGLICEIIEINKKKGT
jgi:hypothetical protein